MKHMAKIAVLIVTLLLYADSGKAVTILTLTGDESQTTPDLVFSEAAALAGTTNDGFAYNVNSPTSPLPSQVYTGGSPNGFHGTNIPAVTVAYTFGTVTGPSFFFDLYGRSDTDGAEFRDNGLVLKLFNGDWVTPVFTSAPFDIPDIRPPTHTRFIVPINVFADRVSITGPNYFTLMEIRAVAPEPAGPLLAMVGGAALLRRRRCRWN
jgi:hypothetical protein